MPRSIPSETGPDARHGARGGRSPRRPGRAAALPAAVVALAALAAACGACGQGSSGGPASANDADWSAFSGSHEPVDPKNVRVVPATPTEITGVPYVRAIRLAWTTSREVPAFEPENQTLHFPAGALQAVLLVNVAALPEDAAVRVAWYYGDRPAYTDELRSRDDGDHYFALVKEEGRRLVPLPPGAYRADVLDGDRLIKSIRFEVSG